MFVIEESLRVVSMMHSDSHISGKARPLNLLLDLLLTYCEKGCWNNTHSIAGVLRRSYLLIVRSIRQNIRITVLMYRPNEMRYAQKTKVRISSVWNEQWPLFKFLDFLFENEVLGYNGGILITKPLIVQVL